MTALMLRPAVHTRSSSPERLPHAKSQLSTGRQPRRFDHWARPVAHRRPSLTAFDQGVIDEGRKMVLKRALEKRVAFAIHSFCEKR